MNSKLLILDQIILIIKLFIDISTKDQLRGRINNQDLDKLIELLKLSESFIYGKKETTDIHSLNKKTVSILERIDKSC